LTNDAVIENYSCFGITYSRRQLLRKQFMLTNHRHNVGEIVFALEGEALITCGNTVVHLKAPFIAHYPAGIAHQQDNSSSEIYARWCFPIYPVPITDSGWIPDRFFAVPLDDEQCRQLSAYVQILYDYWGCVSEKPLTEQPRCSEMDMFRLQHLLLLFLNELKPLVPQSALSEHTYINDVCYYITEHPREQLTLRHLSDRFFVGRTKLTEDFRRAMSMTITEFITKVRIRRAKILLQEGKCLSEIAESSGFSSVSYFIKVFTRHTGLSPTQYRTMLETAEQDN